MLHTQILKSFGGKGIHDKGNHDKNTPGSLILLLELQKAFDTLEWPFAQKPWNTMDLAHLSKNKDEFFIATLKDV